jgi:sulfatase maturation enzyme AslB (radical SAM superfamily)
MCSTHSSYKRVQDLDIISKYQTDGHETKLLRPTTLFESLNKWPELWEHVHTLQFTGGEPIINKEHYDLLESIPKKVKRKIALRYASNLSYIKFKKYDLVEIWNEFKSVNIKISMDGVNDVYNYIRQDGDFKNVHDNMLALQNEPTISLAIGITVQAHNVFHMPEFYQFWKDSEINLRFITANMLQTPRYLTPSLWPEEYREAIITKLKNNLIEHPELQRCISYMENNKPNIRDYAKMRKYTRDLEERYSMGTSLKTMIEDHLNIKLEGMDKVHTRLVKENNNEER